MRTSKEKLCFQLTLKMLAGANNPEEDVAGKPDRRQNVSLHVSPAPEDPGKAGFSPGVLVFGSVPRRPQREELQRRLGFVVSVEPLKSLPVKRSSSYRGLF